MNNRPRIHRTHGAHKTAAWTCLTLVFALVACSGGDFPLEPPASGLHPLGATLDPPEAIDTNMPPLLRAGDLPSSVDLSASFPPVGDQGSQGSCVGWSLSNLHSYHQGLEHGWSLADPRYRSSPAFLYNQLCGGVKCAPTVKRGLTFLTANGDDTWKFFPYNDADLVNQPDEASLGRAARFKPASFSGVSKTADAFKEQLAGGHPVVIGFTVYPDFDNLSAANPIYDSSAGTGRGGHAVVIVGYDDSMQAFRLMNSWGTGWGENGFGWLGYSFLTDSLLKLSGYVLTDAPDAPVGTNEIFITQGSGLWRVDHNYGDWTLVEDGLGATWDGTSAMTTIDDKLYVIRNGRLDSVQMDNNQVTHTVGAFDRTVQALTGAKALTSDGGKLYLALPAGGNIREYDPNSHTTRVLPFTTSPGATMVASRHHLFVVEGDNIYDVDIATGSSSAISSTWLGTSFITSIANKLFALQNGTLYSVNQGGGTVRHVGIPGQWTNVTAMGLVVGSRIFIVSDNTLYDVDSATGAREVLVNPGIWGGTTALASY